jgi:hypothetical protein
MFLFGSSTSALNDSHDDIVEEYTLKKHNNPLKMMGKSIVIG